MKFFVPLVLDLCVCAGGRRRLWYRLDMNQVDGYFLDVGYLARIDCGWRALCSIGLLR
jgi:hypothetical protein